MKKINKYFAIILFVISLSTQFFVVYEADARPGGGSSYRSRSSGRSYSSGSSSRRTYSSSPRVYSSGGSYTGSAGFETIIITLFVIIIIVSLFKKFTSGYEFQTSSAFVVSGDYQEKAQKRNLSISKSIEELKERDPDFSKILFLDFVNSLYNKFYSFLNQDKVSTLRPFISDSDINKARANYKGKINEIVIGSINIISVNNDNYNDYITVEIDANYTAWSNNTANRFLVIERWKLYRKKDILSQPPDVMRTVACPNCASPTDFTDAGQCNYCKTFINKGDMQWAVESMILIDKEVFETKLSTDMQEEGTNLPTVFDPNLNSYKSVYLQRNGEENWNNFWKSFTDNIVNTYFLAIYKAWSENRLIEVRPLLSDRLYESFSFWIESYKRDGLTNKLENIEIIDVELSKIEVDKYYDSITVRISALNNDYVVDSYGKVVSGSRDIEREYTEYWTFIKKSGLQLNENNTDIKKCPNCSAPASNIGQAGKCEYCGSKISNGDFSWVLAIITQDEVYQG